MMATQRFDVWEPPPPKVHRRHGRWFLVHQNKWHSLGRSAVAAQAQYLETSERLGIPAAPDQKFLRALYQKTKSRAKRLKREFDFPLKAFEELWAQARGRCMLTGIKFDLVNAAGHRRRPWVPSVDRIDSRFGYVPGNIRIVCCAANTALSEYGQATFEKLARAYLETTRLSKSERR